MQIMPRDLICMLDTDGGFYYFCWYNKLLLNYFTPKISSCSYSKRKYDISRRCDHMIPIKKERTILNLKIWNNFIFKVLLQQTCFHF
ncbi:Prostaglandin D2 receptor [Dirofilaria immitis]